MDLKKSIALGIIFSFFVLKLLVGQHKEYISFDNNNDLGFDCIYDIKQDNNGLLWVAGDKGLSSLDGNYVSRADLSLLSDYNILNIKNIDGQIFIINLTSEVAVISNNKAYPIKNNNFKIKATDFAFLDEAFFFLDEGSTNYNQSLKQCHYDHSDFTVSNCKIIRTWSEKQRSYNLTATNNKLFYSEQDSVYYLENGKENFAFNHKPVERLKCSNDTLLSYSKNEYKLWSISKKEFIEVQKINNTFRNIILIDDVYIANHNFGVKQVGANRLMADSVQVNTIFKDRNKRLWIGTNNKGLLYENQIFEGIKSKEISHKQSIVTKYFPKHKTLVSIDHSYKLNKDFFDSRNDTQLQLETLTDIKIHSLIDDGTVILSSREFPFIIVDEKVNYLNFPDIAIKDIDIYNDKVVISGSSGTSLLSIKKLIEENGINHQSFISGSLFDGDRGFVSCFLDSTRIVFQNTNGLFLYDTSLKEKIILDSLQLFIELKKGENNNIFGLSNKSKLYQIGSSEIKYITEFESNGFIDFEISESEKTSAFALRNEVIIYNNQLNNLLTINKNNLLPQGEILDIAFNNDSLYIVTDNSLVSLKLSTIINEQPKDSLLISSIIINDKLSDEKSLNELSYHEKNIKINFRYINFNNLEKYKLYYRLSKDEGYNQIINNSIFLSNLSAGNFNLEIAKGINSKFTKTLKSINVTKRKPWWQTIWFYLMTILCTFLITSLIIFSIQKYKRNQENLKNELRKEVNKSKQKILQNQLQPHIIANYLNQISSSSKNLDLVENITELGQFMRNVFTFSDKDFISLEDELEFTNNFINLQKSNIHIINYKVILENLNKEELVDFMVPPMIIQPIIENIFKHGLPIKESILSIQLSIEELETKIKIEIYSNGNNFSKESFKSAINQNSGGLGVVLKRIKYLDQNESKILELKDTNTVILYIKK